jgi:hypothetical protein
VWGNKASVLVGDFLFSRAFQLMVADGSLKVLEILSRASAVIAEGEVLQLVTSNDTETSEQSYLEVIRCKTAALFAAACRIGAVIGNRPKVEEEALESFGLNLGIAFQLIDDVLDYSARQAELGKTIGDDFRDGKITLRSSSPSGAATRPSGRSGVAPWRTSSNATTTSSAPSACSIATAHCATPSPAPATTAPSRAMRLASSRTAWRSAPFSKPSISRSNGPTEAAVSAGPRLAFTPEGRPSTDPGMCSRSLPCL